MNKNVIWTKGHKIKEFFVFPDDRGGDFVDLIGQIAFVKYFEDVIDPSLHVEISMLDPFGVINSLPVRSGSSVILKIEHPSQKELLDLTLVITNITGHVLDQKREVYNLSLIHI